MRLHENKELFTDAISITAEYLKLPEIYVEKDYWVTLIGIATELDGGEYVTPDDLLLDENKYFTPDTFK